MRPISAPLLARRGSTAVTLALAMSMVVIASVGSVPASAGTTGASTGAVVKSAAPMSAALMSAVSAVSARRGCVKAGKRFRPTSLGIPGISKRRTVLALGRDRRNVPKAPPLSDSGKRQYAWDTKDKIKAGARHGVAKLNAHTYPDGSAIGNDLIRELYEGDRLDVQGRRGQQRCYKVIDRVQIPAEKRFKRYYRTSGPHRLAIAVCSGVRRGPGDWSHRTIWFAKIID